MNPKKHFKYIIIPVLITASFLTLYANSFKNVEQVCRDKKNTEVYLLNYVTKQHLKEIINEHNQTFKFKGDELTRVYLLNPIFELPDPIFDTKIDYREKGCELIDNMDIYCEVRYSKLKNGEIDVWYNFM